jgi:hypothetical protein
LLRFIAKMVKDSSSAFSALLLLLLLLLSPLLPMSPRARAGAQDSSPARAGGGAGKRNSRASHKEK